jgi:hypothetical protein
MRQRLTPVFLMVAVASLSGCFDQKQTWTVNPDGSGKIAIRMTLGKDVSQMIVDSRGKSPEDQKRAIEDLVLEDIASWSNIAAWTDLKTGLKDGQIEYSATGWFTDLSKVTSEGFTYSWTSEKPGQFTLGMKQKKQQEKNPLDQSDQESNQTREMMKNMVKGLRFELEAVLPGNVGEILGFTERNGRSAKLLFTDKTLEDYLNAADGLRDRIKKGQITREQAEKDLDAKLSIKDLRATCSPGGTESELQGFQESLKKAISDYSNSDLSKKIDEKKAAKKSK